MYADYATLSLIKLSQGQHMQYVYIRLQAVGDLVKLVDIQEREVAQVF